MSSLAKDLEDIGISKESAALADYQFSFLQQMGDSSHVETYQNLINETVIAARERIIAYYLDKIEFEEDKDFITETYVPEIIQANLDAITSSFNRNFGGLLSGNEEYQELDASSIESSEYRKKQKQEHVRQVMEEQHAKYIDEKTKEKPQEKQSIGSRIKEAISSFFGKPKSQATTEQRTATRKEAAKKQGVFSKAVSALKSFFGRGK